MNTFLLILRYIFIGLGFLIFTSMAWGVLLTVKVLCRASRVDDAQRFPPQAPEPELNGDTFPRVLNNTPSSESSR